MGSIRIWGAGRKFGKVVVFDAKNALIPNYEKMFGAVLIVEDTAGLASRRLIAYTRIRRLIMTAVRAVYDGKVFIPVKPCEITRGAEVTLTIEPIDSGFTEKQKKLMAFRQLSREISELNKTDPLPPGFDEVLSQRLHFREPAFL